MYSPVLGARPRWFGVWLFSGALSVGVVMGCRPEEALRPVPPLPPPLTGEIALTVATTGRLPDPDGYRLLIDGVAVGRMSPSQERVVSLTLGRHTVQLDELASNCLVVGDNPRVVYISNGVRTPMTLDIECPAPSGITISTVTEGSDPDPDGYVVAIVPGPPTGASVNVSENLWADLPAQGELAVSGTRPGFYQILLRGLAANCSVHEGKTRGLLVEEDQTARVAFQVLCQPRQPDALGEWLVVASHDNRVQADDDLYLIATDGTRRRQLTDHPGFDGSPEFSPDAERIAFYRYFRGTGSLVVLERATGRESALPRQANGSKLAWSPDGTRIAFERDGDIYLVRADGTAEARLTTGQGPYWSPDGSRIAFTNWGGGPAAVYLINVDGSNQTRLTHGSDAGRVAGPWSPDGRNLLVSGTCNEYSYYSYYSYYCDYASQPLDLFITEVEGGEEQRLTNTADVGEWAPVWATDGQRVFFLGPGTGGSDIFVTRLGASPVNLTNSLENEAWLSFGTIGGAASRLASAARGRP